MIDIVQTPRFQNSVKKLHKNQKKDLDIAIRHLADNPESGLLKKGDLSDIRVHKFKMAKQLTLLAYSYDKNILILTLLAIGSHENFYRDLKK